jgi:hypothetical protein
VKEHGLTPRARILGMASAAVPPRIMGIGPVPATRKLMERLGLKISDFDLIELNEAFASQGSPACASSASRTMPISSIRMAAPSRSAIPLGMSGARLALTAVHGMEEARRQARAGHHVRRRRPGRRDGDREVPYDPIFNSVTDEKARARMVSIFDLENTVPDWALCFRWDIVLRGREQTPLDTDKH